MPLVPSEGSIGKNALLSRVSELGIGVNKTRGFLASLVDRGMLFEWHIPRPGTNPEVRIARHEQTKSPGDLYGAISTLPRLAGGHHGPIRSKKP